MTEEEALRPVDPYTIPFNKFRRKVGIIVELDLINRLPKDNINSAVRPCYTCRRPQAVTKTHDEMMSYHRKRFGFETTAPALVCEDCNNIISDFLGIPR